MAGKKRPSTILSLQTKNPGSSQDRLQNPDYFPSERNCIFAHRNRIEKTISSVIQRIQTVYLLLASLLDLGVFFNPLYSHAMDDPYGWIGIGFAIVLTAAEIMALVCIFLYKDRKNQIRWVKRTMLVQVIALGWAIGILFSLGGFGTFLWDEVLGVGLLILALAGLVMAFRNIKKDEELVSSMDRIR